MTVWFLKKKKKYLGYGVINQSINNLNYNHHVVLHFKWPCVFLSLSLILSHQLVLERSHVSGEFFNLYLHQNYVDFFSDVEDVARAGEYLSDADFLTAEWTVSS